MRTLIWTAVVVAVIVGAMVCARFWRQRGDMNVAADPKVATASGAATPAANAAPDEATLGKPTAADIDAFIAPQLARLEATRRPVIRIELMPMSEDELRISKVGGRAYWPRGQRYPTGADGRALYLLAQIDFAQVPATDGYPNHGLLQFYIADTDSYGMNFDGGMNEAALSRQRDYRVVYWPDTQADPEAMTLPPSNLLPHDPDKPRRMVFSVETELLTLEDHRFDGLFAGNAYAAIESYATAHDLDQDALHEALSERFRGSGHKLGGYPFFTQTDPRSDGALELLFQLDTDEQMMWGDSGIGGFFIAPADLARADFSRVMYNWDCY
jgi:uncharacterized protein YwqG